MDFKTNVDCTTCKYCFESVDVHGITKRYCTLHNAQIVYCDVTCNEYDKGKCKEKNYFTAHNKVLLNVDNKLEETTEEVVPMVEEQSAEINDNNDISSNKDDDKSNTK